MRCTISIFAIILLAINMTGCRTQTSTISNPFLAPDRVPPPATQTPNAGVALPYYPGDQVPSGQAIGTPPGTFAPQQFVPQQVTPQQFVPQQLTPQPAGTVPPGGWSPTPQALPGGSASRNVLPSNIQQASNIQIQTDQQNLRFAPNNFTQPSSPITTTQPVLPPDPTILPTPVQPFHSNGVQPAAFNAALPTNQFATTAAPIAQPREVRIRAISSDNLPIAGKLRTRDGFRPQGASDSSQPLGTTAASQPPTTNVVRKPILLSRLTRQRSSSGNESDRL